MSKTRNPKRLPVRWQLLRGDRFCAGFGPVFRRDAGGRREKWQRIKVGIQMEQHSNSICGCYVHTDGWLFGAECELHVPAKNGFRCDKYVHLIIQIATTQLLNEQRP